MMRPGSSACAALGFLQDPDAEQGGEQHSDDRDQCTREHREGGRSVGERRGLFLFLPLLQMRDHHFDGDHRVIDQQPERDDEGTQRDSLQVDPEELHRHEDRSEDKGDREGHHGARA
jgi:hypothetical protein